MPDAFTSTLRLLLMETGENDNTWGDRHNSSVTSLIEAAIGGRADINVSSGNVTLTTNNGSADQARNAVLRATGTPGTSRDIVVPSVTKLYVVTNETSDDSDVVVKTASGTGVTIESGDRRWLYVDAVGDEVYDLSAVGTVAEATNALQLGGVVAANYARRDAANTFTAANTFEELSLFETTARSAVTTIASGATPTPDGTSGSNVFRFAPAVNYTFQKPANPPSGAWAFSVIIDHAGNVSGAFGTGYVWQSGQAPTIAQASAYKGLLVCQYDPTDDVYIANLVDDVS